MDYQKAKDLRSKSFSDLMTDKLTGGQGIGSSLRETLSEKTKAKMTGIKETFDPMNIVKTMTFGSKLGPALYGKMMGRSKEDMKYFTDKKTRGPGKNKTPGQMDSQADSMAVDALGLIYRLMLRNQEEEKLRIEESKGSIEERDSEEELRNQELVKALTGRRKKEKPFRDEKGRFAKRPTEEKPKPEPTKEPPKKGGKKEEAPKPTGEKPKVEKVPPKEAPKAPEKVPPKEAPPAPKPSTEKAPAPTAPSVKPSTVAKVTTGAAITASGAFGSADAFAREMAPEAEKASKSLGGVPVNALLGQWALESGWGKSVSGDYNYFGIKAQPSYTGDKKLVTTREVFTDAQAKAFISGMPGREIVSQSGNNYKVKDWFRSYKSIGEAVEDKVNFLKSNKRYAAAGVFDAKTPEQFFTALQKAGYATDPNYVSSGVAMAASVDKKLKKINDGTPSTSVPSPTSSSSTGSQIDQSSKENKDLKESLNKDKPKQTTTNNTTVSAENKETKQSTEAVDDRPAHLKKKG